MDEEAVDTASHSRTQESLKNYLKIRHFRNVSTGPYNPTNDPETVIKKDIMTYTGEAMDRRNSIIRCWNAGWLRLFLVWQPNETEFYNRA